MKINLPLAKGETCTPPLTKGGRGDFHSKEVVVIADSGYDDKKIEKAIIMKRWRFIIALSKTRSVKSEKEYLYTLNQEGGVK